MIVPPAGPMAVGKATTSPAWAFSTVTAMAGAIWKAGVKAMASPGGGARDAGDLHYAVRHD